MRRPAAVRTARGAGAPLAWLAGAALAVVVAGVAGCARREPHAPALASGQLRGANVLLVTIDTLRRDRLGAYGNPNGLTPTLDRLAASGLKYVQAYSAVPMTLPAHATILTGLTPRHHGVRNNVSFRLDDRVPTLATRLKAAGYRTGAVVGAFVLDARFGLNRGFDRYDDRYPQDTGAFSFEFVQRTAEQVLAPAYDWITSTSAPSTPAPSTPAPSTPAPSTSSVSPAKPWFAWVHLFDPHAPYDAPAAYRPGRSPYDAEVAYTDAMLGRFFDRLRAAHALDRTIVVVTADHGESLGEHGETTHGLFAYNATLAVPLILAGPSIGPGVVDAPVSHVDIVPTVLDLLGLGVPAGLDGRSLVHEPARERALYFEALDANLTRGWAPLTGVVRDGWKYIDLPIPELYDLAADPGETHNLAARERGRVDSLAAALASIVSAGNAGAPSGPLDADAAARLRALGYTGGLAAPRARPFTDADDPKRLVQLNERFNTALEWFSEGRRDDALRAFEAIVRERPDFSTARTSEATVLLSEGRAADAVTVLRQAPPDQADSPELMAKLGSALSAAGDLAGAAATLERARQAGDQNPDLYNDLGVVYARLGRTDEARAMFETLVRQAPSAAGTWFNLGVLELQSGRADAAAAALRHAVDARPSYGEAWQALGSALIERDPAGAIDAWRHAEPLRPKDYDLLFNLGMTLADHHRPAEAAPYLERFIREAPPDKYARDLPAVRAALARMRR